MTHKAKNLEFSFYCVSIRQSLENHILCVCPLKGKTPKTLNNTPAKVNGSSRHYSVGANQRKMTRYILTWMNTDEIHIHTAYKEKASNQGKTFITGKDCEIALCFSLCLNDFSHPPTPPPLPYSFYVFLGVD